MSPLPPNICQLARKLFAQIGSLGKDAEVAQEKLKRLLSGHGLSWNDLPRILVADTDAVVATPELVMERLQRPRLLRTTYRTYSGWFLRCSKSMLPRPPNSAWPLRCGSCIVGCSSGLRLRLVSPCSLPSGAAERPRFSG